MKNINLFRKGKQQYLFLFVDLIANTEISANFPGSIYAGKYIGSFHWAVNRAKSFIQANYIFPKAQFRRVIQNITLAGDQVNSFSQIDTSKSTDIQDLIASSVAFVYMIQLYFLASPFNLERMKKGLPIKKIAAGLHIGPANDVPSEDFNDLASLHINLTKRIEESARDGTQSNIFATINIVDVFNAWQTRIKNESKTKYRPPLSYAYFGDPTKHDIKGMRGQKIETYELELIQTDNDLEKLLDELLTNSDIENVENFKAEYAASIMATNFLVCNGYPFRYSNGRRAISHYKYKNASEYINDWFTELDKNENLTFVDSIFMALNYSIISGAFMRHPEVEEKSDTYAEIGKNKFESFRKKFFKKNSGNQSIAT